MIDFGTILLSDTPILRYNDLKKYDTISHKLSLGISDHCFTNVDTIQMQMFVVTINKEPIYVGFRRFVMEPPYALAPTVDWVYINIALDKSSNDIYIGFEGEEDSDPRLGFEKLLTD
jgi:hypothetical protein